MAEATVDVSGAVVAMSGGVDSSVAALLALRSGLDCVGVMLALTQKTDCQADDEKCARAVAARLGIPFRVHDLSDAFGKHVINNFVQTYRRGSTPNPCIDCNRHIKFGILLDWTLRSGRSYIVTGHHARVEREGGAGGRYLLKKSSDPAKDQSYVLYTLTQEQLSHVILPLGSLDKAQVREIARENGFTNADRPESQDICFVQKGGYADFILSYCGCEPSPGRFVDMGGHTLGEHKGIIHYTVGQRRGLGLAAECPMYVQAIRASDNTIVVGPTEALYAKTLTARKINLIASPRIDGRARVLAKARYRQKEQPATVWQTGPDELRVEFDSPQRALTPGQSVVLYDGDTVIGGGVIDEVLDHA